MRAIVLPASLFLLAIVVSAQDELPPDEVQDLVERYVERGVESYREGGYDEARLRFKKALKRDKSNLGARIGIAAKIRPTMHPHGTWGTVGSAVAVLI